MGKGCGHEHLPMQGLRLSELGDLEKHIALADLTAAGRRAPGSDPRCSGTKERVFRRNCSFRSALPARRLSLQPLPQKPQAAALVRCPRARRTRRLFPFGRRNTPGLSAHPRGARRGGARRGGGALPAWPGQGLFPPWGAGGGGSEDGPAGSPARPCFASPGFQLGRTFVRRSEPCEGALRPPASERAAGAGRAGWLSRPRTPSPPAWRSAPGGGTSGSRQGSGERGDRGACGRAGRISLWKT